LYVCGLAQHLLTLFYTQHYTATHNNNTQQAGVPGGHIITGGDKTAEQLVSIKADIQAAAATPAFAAMFFATAAGPTNKDSLLFSDRTGAFAEVAPSTIYTLGNAYDAYATIGRVRARNLIFDAEVKRTRLVTDTLHCTHTADYTLWCCIDTM
jgi:hypothetical protein